MPQWSQSLRVYREPRLLAIFFMGFASGLPFGLSGGTLTRWLSEAGIARSAIGAFALVAFSYNFKFLWSPLVDRFEIPILTRRMGRRRSWALVIQLALMAAIGALGLTDPGDALAPTVWGAIAVAFLSASQDIVIDAYRVELLRPEEQGAGAAATQWGYRLGMLASGAGTFYVAAFGGWHVAYAAMAALMAVGIVTVILTPEPQAIRPRIDPSEHWLVALLVRPIADFVARCGGRFDGAAPALRGIPGFLWSGRLALVILAFTLLYKLGEAMAGFMASPLYQELGFDKIEVANIQKIFGVAASIAGVGAGGIVVARLGTMQALLVGGVLQALSNLMYVVQVVAGHDPLMLTVSIFVENFTNGIGSAAFVAYLSGLCSLSYTATQYALFSSLATLLSRFASAPSGWLVDRFDWIPFFLLTALATLPGLAVLLWLMRRPAPAPIAVE